MKATSSRLLNRLDDQIAAATSTFAADCLRCERACYLARQGHFDEVHPLLAELHQRYDTNPHVAVSTWLSLAEGLMSHFSDMGSLARDKFRRANALSAAAGLTPLHALSAAWLANMDYLQVDIVSMARHVSQALQLASADHHSARSRANLVVAHAYHLAGRLDLALPWYTRARGHAAAEGDDATIGALIHNMTWLRAANIRQAVLSGVGNAGSSDGEHALLGAESIWNFDQLFGATGLTAIVHVLRAQILAIQNHPAEALDLYEKHLKSALEIGLERMKGSLLADQAWCRLRLGQSVAALRDALTAEANIDSTGHFDDRAPGYRSKYLRRSAMQKRHNAMGNWRRSLGRDTGCFKSASWKC